MLKTVSGAAAIVLALVSASIASAQTTLPPARTMAPLPMMNGAHGHLPNKNCTSAANFVVWLMPSTKTYYRKGQTPFGKGAGRYVCRRQAIASGARLGAGSAALPVVKTMAPRPMGSAVPMPMSSPMPNSSMRSMPMASPSASPRP